MDKCKSKGKDFGIAEVTDFITVVSVGVNNKTNTTAVGDSVNANNIYNENTTSSDYVTVLTIGEEEFNKQDIQHHEVEEVLVYRLPGERLGLGLKFDGGIKASEPVRRLFIQSCAVDSPASRVKSSWGILVEGDEILEIDRVSVSNMTRIDCVRCLKDSNVVITLLIRHLGCQIPDAMDPPCNPNAIPHKVDIINDIEKKQVPPSPPPVPPRKIPRNSTKKTDISRSDSLKKVRRSPECAKRDASRLLADGGIVPPEAQVYLDLLSQESLYSLSESDDTNSSISTVVDRLSSFPTTSASSLAGSLPSTPTAIQNKRLQLNNFLSSLEADMHFISDKNYYLFERLTSLQSQNERVQIEDTVPTIPIRSNAEPSIASLPLRPPANFQDAPLSYGNEDVRVMEATIEMAALDLVEKSMNPRRRSRQNPANIRMRRNLSTSELIEVERDTTISMNRNGIESESIVRDQNLCSPTIDDVDDEQKVVNACRKIRPPPRIKQQRELNNNEYTVALSSFEEDSPGYNTTHDNNCLPRLVDFVPKYGNRSDKDPEDNHNNALRQTDYTVNSTQVCVENGSVWNTVEYSSCSWKSTPTTQLATIGEVEESPQLSLNEVVNLNDVPVFSVTHHNEEVDTNDKIANNPMGIDTMTSPPIYSRQPPDGHEFPDYEECHQVDDDESTKTIKNKSNFMTFSKLQLRVAIDMSNNNSENTRNAYRSSLDLALLDSRTTLDIKQKTDDVFGMPKLHSRSQSLVDISKPNQWSQINDQRRRGFSKLKGLVIPEHVPENKAATPLFDLPEITSSKMLKISDFELPPHQNPPVILPPPSPAQSKPVNSLSPIWNQDNSLPKYSPAFKRRSLQLHSINSNGLSSPAVPSTAVPIRNTSSEFMYPEYSAVRDVQKTTITAIASTDEPVSLRNSSVLYLNDSDNDSAFKSCESLNQDENQCLQNTHTNTSNRAEEMKDINQKNITSAVSIRSRITPPAISREMSKVTQESKLDDINQTNSKLTTFVSEKRVCNDKFNIQPLKQFSKDVAKNDMDQKLRTNNNNNNLKSYKTVPKNMQCKAVSSVNDLRKKFQVVDANPVTKHNNKTTPPQISKPKSSPQNAVADVIVKLDTDIFAESPKQESTMKDMDTDAMILKTLSEFGDSIPSKNCSVAILKPEMPGGSLGLTLAGGTDYETKEITIYSVRVGSIASKDTGLKRGDQVLSINGITMKNVTHADTVALLKEPVPEVVIIFCSKNEPSSTIAITSKRNSLVELNVQASKELSTLLPPVCPNVDNIGKCLIVNIVKTSAGLGFSIAGGHDSPNGDVPLIVKKVFAGGAAEKSGSLHADDELLSIGSVDVRTMSRLDVWTMMKKLPEGAVTLKVRRL